MDVLGMQVLLAKEVCDGEGRCVFICNWIKKRRKPRANNVTLKLE
jgi:hypothetical protein